MSENDLADSPFESVDDPAQGSSEGSSQGGPLNRLFDGNAQGPSTQEIEADYGLPKWAAITGRGILRVATGSGVPPAFEIVFGTGLGAAKLARSSDLDLGDGDSDEPGPQPVPADGS